MNVFNAIGRVGNDAEVRFTADGTAVASWSLAVSSGYGEKAKTNWVNCSLFGKRAEAVSKFIKKGGQVGVTGELSLREYETKDGKKGSSLDLNVANVTLVGGEKDAQPKPAKEEGKANGFQPQGADFDDFESDVPF